jgi:hypothetical protein
VNKIISFVTIFLLTTLVFAGGKPQLLYQSAGDISQAILSNNGLVIERETSSEIADMRSLGLAQTFVPMPALNSDQRIVFSPNGLYALLLTFTGCGDYLEVVRAEKYSLESGRLIKIWDKPGFTDAVVSDAGNVVGILRNINIPEMSALKFYSINGELLKTVTFPSALAVKFAQNGQMLGALSGERGLVLFNSEGKEFADLGPCQWFNLVVEKSSTGSDADEYVKCVYSNGAQIALFSERNPNVHWRKNLGGEIFRDVAVDNLTGYVIAISKHNLYHLSAKNGEVVWQQLIEAPVSLTSCDITSRNGKIQFAWGWEIDNGREVSPEMRHNAGGFSWANKDASSGFSVNSEKLAYSAWNVFTPKVEFTSKGLLIQTMDQVLLMNLSER